MSFAICVSRANMSTVTFCFFQKWTPELDRFLKEGVRQYGVGKWARILLDYDFEGRTGTMLKDRWRTLIKGNLAP